MNQSTKTAFLVTTMIFLSSCALLGSGISRADKIKEAQIKTQLAIEYASKLKDYRQAIQNVDQALAINSSDYTTWWVRAQIYQALKVYDVANQSFLKALKLKPDQAEVNRDYALFLCDNLNKYSDALPYFDKALADPVYELRYSVFRSKGDCLMKMSRFEDALSAYKQSFVLRPQIFEMYRKLANVYMKLKDFKNAEVMFVQYQRIVKELNADDLFLGWSIYRALGKKQEAYEYAQQLRLYFPNSEQVQLLR